MTAPHPTVPPDPYATRQARLLRALRAATVTAAVLAALAVVLPDPAGSYAGGAAVAVLIAAPLLRVAWLAVRWARRNDVRFALAAAGLLALAGLGPVLVSLF